MGVLSPQLGEVMSAGACSAAFGWTESFAVEHLNDGFLRHQPLDERRGSNEGFAGSTS